jgi:16S rRNA (cytosine1407-C5)-methyltransferase
VRLINSTKQKSSRNTRNTIRRYLIPEPSISANLPARQPSYLAKQNKTSLDIVGSPLDAGRSLTTGRQVNPQISAYLNNLFGKESANKYYEFLNRETSQFIRVNTRRISTEQLSKLLFSNYGIATENVEGLPFALKVVKGKDLIGKTVEHIIGLYYIQSLASMLPTMVLSPSETDKVLDLCAAPGSKTTQLAQQMKNRGTLIANEISLERLKSLVFNIDRLAIINTGVTHTKGEWLSKYYQNYFDKILVDAPCSGLGIIQKKEEVNQWWSIDRVSKLSDLQLRLLISAVKMLKIGGEIVYSTCTLTTEENEFIINKVLKKYPLEIQNIELPVKTHNGFTNIDNEKLNPTLTKAKRIIPWEVDTEGFFIVKLKKTEITEATEKEKTKFRSQRIKATKFFSYEKKEVKNYLKSLEKEFGIKNNILKEYKYLIKKNSSAGGVFFIHKSWDDPNPEIFNRIGIKLGTFDRKGKITLHSNAVPVLAEHITKNILEIHNQEDLQTYLEGGIIKNHELKQGQHLIKYNQLPIGTAVVTSGGIKSRFPRAKRTQQIYFE